MTNGSDPEDDDLGAPIAELAELSEPPRRGFLDRVRSAIDRRRLGSQVVGLWWHGLALVVLEFVTIVTGLVGGTQAADKARDGDPPSGTPTA